LSSPGSAMSSARISASAASPLRSLPSSMRVSPASALRLYALARGDLGVGWRAYARSRRGRPLVDTLADSRIPNLTELRPATGGRTEIRILFVFGPWRSAVLLVAGDNAGRWRDWYGEAIPRVERLYQTYCAARRKEMDQ
jgi:hypothetical protein